MKLRCRILGHCEIVVGRCSSKRDHYCAKSKIICRRCGMILTTEGWRSKITKQIEVELG